MSDIFDPNRNGMPQADEAAGSVPAQETQAIPPVAPARRRRTDRNRAAYEEAAAAEMAENQEEAGEESALGGTRAVTPVQGAPAQEQPPRFQTRYTPVVPGGVPSQGVPRPATLTGVTTRRPAVNPQATTARRPVNAEGYTPIQPLGTPRPAMRGDAEGASAAPRPRRPEMQPQAMDARRQRGPVAANRYDTQPQQQSGDEGGSGVGGGLTVIIIALLVLAALIVGMLLIPNDDPGMLGQIKRTVMAPLNGLLGGEKDNATAPQASGFTATLAQDTAPYKIVFMLETSNSVSAVRVVDADGNPMPTVNPVNYPSGESTIWMFEMILETGYEGLVQAQIQDGDTWMDTGLQHTLSIGTSAPPTISSVPVTTAPVITSTPVADAPLLTADSLQEPTVSPTMAAIDEPDAAAAETLMPIITPAATDAAELPAPVETPVPTPVASPTPTLSMTATPTLMPTTTPAATEILTEEPTEVPTATPVPEPTATPTPAPTPVPVATPALEASACEAADPSIITTTRIYEGKSRVEEYERPERERVNMLPGDEYVLRQASVSTFRGTAFRQNASVGTLSDPTSMRQLWVVEAGSSAGKSRNYYGFGSKSQPVIMKFSVEVRSLMNLNEAAASQRVLKEVIIAGMDGKIYFLNLEDGTPTRDPINLGFPVNAAVTLDPLSYPVMLVGQFGKRMENKTYDIGLRYYSLADQKQLRFIDGEDGKLDRHYNNVGSFGNSTLIDRTSKTVVAVGTNGLLYTERMDMALNQNKVGDQMTYHFSFEDPTQVAMMSHTSKQADSRAAVESALAMYGGYAYYADMDGILRCVDVNTMTTVWAVDVGDAVHSAIALDLDKSTNTLWLYVADTLDRVKKGNVSISRYNAMTGEKDWTLPVHCAVGSKKDVTHNDEVIPGAMASPVVGQNELKDLVYYTLSSLSKTGAETVTGDGSRALSGVVIALNKATGKVVWHKAMDAYCYSSPVAVYNADGKGWLIQACSNGTLYLMDGLTGAEVATLQLPGVIEGSPAVYGSTLVIGTTGKGSSYIYGVELE